MRNTSYWMLFLGFTSLSQMAAAGAVGQTPGMTSGTTLPTAAHRLDMFITPGADPGPASNVFWSNQLDSLGGYTGMQTTELSDAEGHGRQFLFSLWGATDARPGTPASAGIGAGSYCTVSKTATDGDKGAQCRYRYEWQVGHTYRFRVTPDEKLGKGWYKSNVTDVTPDGDGTSFDIGSIYKPAFPADIPSGDIKQWVEYFDWGNPRTTCLSVARSDVRMSAEAFDAQGRPIYLPAYAMSGQNSCQDQPMAIRPTFTRIARDGSGVRMEGATSQTAEGFIRSAGSCLISSLPQGGVDQTVSIGACPTKRMVEQKGGRYFSQYFWVLAADGSIQQKSSQCLTAKTGSRAIVVSACAPGQAAQRWRVAGSTDGDGQSVRLVSGLSGLCLGREGSGLAGMSACTDKDVLWTVPGKSFQY